MIARRLLRDERGISSVEFAMVAVVFLMIVFSIIDFCMALWEANMAAYATRVGARTAVVNNIVSIKLRTLDGTQYAPIGTSIPVADFPATIDNPMYCTIDGCGPDPNGAMNAADRDLAAFRTIADSMEQVDKWIKDANIIIKYQHVGLGLAGNPAGPDIDPMITVSLRGIRHNFISPALLMLPDSILMPPFTTTLSGEDGQS